MMLELTMAASPKAPTGLHHQLMKARIHNRQAGVPDILGIWVNRF